MKIEEYLLEEEIQNEEKGKERRIKIIKMKLKK